MEFVAVESDDDKSDTDTRVRQVENKVRKKDRTINLRRFFSFSFPYFFSSFCIFFFFYLFIFFILRCRLVAALVVEIFGGTNCRPLQRVILDCHNMQTASRRNAQREIFLRGNGE